MTVAAATPIPSTRTKIRQDLEERTMRFASDVRAFAARLPRAMMTSEDVRQLIRASGSVGANYIEASESLGKGNFMMRLRICLKESKECAFWLRLLEVGSSKYLQAEKERLSQEAVELLKIFASSIATVRRKQKAALTNSK